MEFSSNNNKFTNNPVLSSDYAVTQAAAMKNRVSGGTRPDYCLNDAKAAMSYYVITPRPVPSACVRATSPSPEDIPSDGVTTPRQILSANATTVPVFR